MGDESWVKDLVNKRWAAILAFGVFFLFTIIVLVGLFTEKHINLFGLEFNGKVKDESKIDKNSDSKPEIRKTAPIHDTIRIYERNRGRSYRAVVTPPATLNNTASSSSYNFKDKVEATNLQIGNNNTLNSYGLQPPVITEESMEKFFILFPDPSILIRFAGPSEEGGILNIKKQLVNILTKKGYKNLSKDNGVQIIIGGEYPNDKISVLPSSTSLSVTFYIPSGYISDSK
jgi:hypothetical protein